MTGTGLFLSFEGIDGSGKSTQARLLAEALRAKGRTVTLTREPGGSPGAEQIRALVLEGAPDRWSAETELLLFTAARRDHLEKTIRPALDRGEVVITDRFADSTRVYQGISRGDLRGLVDQLHDAMIGVEPDVTVLIDMDPAKALGRSLARLARDEQQPTERLYAKASAHAAGAAASAAEGSATSAAAFAAAAVADAAQSPASADRAKSLDWAVEAIGAGEMPEDRFESFGPLFQSRLRDGFLTLAAMHPRFLVIDGDRPEATVAGDIVARVRARLGA